VRGRKQDEARLSVQVQPRASRNEIVAAAGGSLRVRVTAPPAGGAANDAVRALLAEALDCPRSAVTILRGHSARTKLVGIAGVAPEEARARLAAIAP
jgi:uncharacterized protein (TIGR00251 family)